LTKSERWILSEWIVAKNRVFEFSECLLHHRLKTPYAEVDLLFARSDGRLNLVEVKSFNSSIYGDFWADSLLPLKQSMRLKRAHHWLSEKFHKEVILSLSVVKFDDRGLIDISHIVID
jgi:Holliday junction resolvase-like predicted endonuclease